MSRISDVLRYKKTILLPSAAVSWWQWIDFVFFHISAFWKDYDIACCNACWFIQCLLNYSKISWKYGDEISPFFTVFYSLRRKPFLQNEQTENIYYPYVTDIDK